MRRPAVNAPELSPETSGNVPQNFRKHPGNVPPKLPETFREASAKLPRDACAAGGCADPDAQLRSLRPSAGLGSHTVCRQRRLRVLYKVKGTNRVLRVVVIVLRVRITRIPSATGVGEDVLAALNARARVTSNKSLKQKVRPSLSRRRCGQGVSPVPAQMWAGASPVPAQM